MRKERKEAVYRAEERKQMIIEWIVGLICACVGALILGFIIYIIGIFNGNW